MAPADGLKDGNGTSVQFSCDVGYNLIGSSSVECLDDGTGWSADPPACGLWFYYLRVFVLPIEHLWIQCLTLIMFCILFCYTCYFVIHVCLTDGCDSPVSPDGGYYNLSTDGSVTMATYSCNIGYTVSGQRISHCQDDGSWNVTVPSCSKKIYSFMYINSSFMK